MNKTSLAVVAAVVVVAATVAIYESRSTARMLPPAVLDGGNTAVDQKWEKINSVLNQTPVILGVSSRQPLFHVGDYSNGKVTNERGSLPDVQLVKSREQILGGLPPNFKGHVFQIGMPQAHFSPALAESEVMVLQVQAILASP